MKLKRLLVLVVGLAVSIALIGCNNATTDASIPDGYVLISKTDTSEGYLTEYQHIKTKCYYTEMDGFKSGAFTQMFIEKEGVGAVPYCE